MKRLEMIVLMVVLAVPAWAQNRSVRGGSSSHPPVAHNGGSPHHVMGGGVVVVRSSPALRPVIIVHSAPRYRPIVVVSSGPSWGYNGYSSGYGYSGASCYVRNEVAEPPYTISCYVPAGAELDELNAMARNIKAGREAKQLNALDELAQEGRELEMKEELKLRYPFEIVLLGRKR